MSKNRMITALPGILGFLTILSVLTWAKPCTGTLTLSSGMEVPMACYYLKIAAFAVSVILISLSLSGITQKHLSALPVIICGLMLAALTFSGIVGIRICAGDVCSGNACGSGSGIFSTGGMPCHTTAVFLRVIGLLTALCGCISLYDPEKQL